MIVGLAEGERVERGQQEVVGIEALGNSGAAAAAAVDQEKGVERVQ